MVNRRRPRLSYANVVATAALVIAVAGPGGGGAAVADAVKKLAPGSVTTKAIKNNAVTGAKVKNGSLGGADVKNGSLGGADVADGSLGGQDLARRSVGGEQIALNSVAGNRLVPNSVDSSRIADRSLTADDLADFTLSNNKISNGTLTFSKFSLDAKAGLSRYWDANAVLPGSVLTGYAATAYVAGDPSGNGDRDVRAVSFSFPALVETIHGAAGARKADGSPNPNCRGSFAEPKAAPGWACYYLKPDSTADNHVGTLEPLSYGPRGFAVTYLPGGVAGDWTFAEVNWAYTAP